jgi:hypothetical protein
MHGRTRQVTRIHHRMLAAVNDVAYCFEESTLDATTASQGANNDECSE